MHQDTKTQLLTKSPKELLFTLAVPGIVGMIVIGLYPFMDGVFAGRIIGDYAMSAISISMSLTILNGGISAFFSTTDFVEVDIPKVSKQSITISKNRKEFITVRTGGIEIDVPIETCETNLFKILQTAPSICD